MKHVLASFALSALLLAGCSTPSHRVPANSEEPSGPLGLPVEGGGAWPEGAVGEPVPMDVPCQQAASESALKAVVQSHRGCNVWQADAITMNEQYRVHVQCGKDELYYKVNTRSYGDKCTARTAVRYNGQ